jgi:DNA-binding MarR family transcriptional regulator
VRAECTGAGGWCDAPGRGRVRDTVELSDSALSKQLTTLEQAGYAEMRKGFIGKRPRTSARLTAQGRAAFEQHVAALQQIVVRSGATILPPG